MLCIRIGGCPFLLTVRVCGDWAMHSSGSHSSVGESVRLITVRSAVQARVGPIFQNRRFNIYVCHTLRQASANCSLSTVPISIVSLLIGPLSHCRLPHAPIDPLFHFPMQASGNCSASTVPISIVSLIIGPLSHCRLSHAAIVPLSNFPLTTPACSNPPAVVFRYTVDIATARHASR